MTRLKICINSYILTLMVSNIHHKEKKIFEHKCENIHLNGQLKQWHRNNTQYFHILKYTFL